MVVELYSYFSKVRNEVHGIFFLAVCRICLYIIGEVTSLRLGE